MNPRLEFQGLSFELLLDLPTILGRVHVLASDLNARYADSYPIIVPVLTGAYMLLADLVPLLNFPYELCCIKLSSYGSSLSSTGKPQVPSLLIPPKGRDIIILEDIVDSGLTLAALEEVLGATGAKSVYTATLLFKPGQFQAGRKPNWIGFDITEAFVVGYGMDYAEQGRYLRAVYQKVD